MREQKRSVEVGDKSAQSSVSAVGNRGSAQCGGNLPLCLILRTAPPRRVVLILSDERRYTAITPPSVAMERDPQEAVELQRAVWPTLIMLPDHPDIMVADFELRRDLYPIFTPRINDDLYDPSRTNHSRQKSFHLVSISVDKYVRLIRMVQIISGAERWTERTRCKDDLCQKCTHDPRDTDHQCRNICGNNSVQGAGTETCMGAKGNY